MKRRNFIKAVSAIPFLSIPTLAFPKMDDNYPKTCDELVQMMEDRHRVGEPTARRLSVTGEPYTLFVNGVGKPEGVMTPDYVSDEETAIKVAWEGFKSYSNASGSDSVLYWRIKPELYTWDMTETNHYNMAGDSVVDRKCQATYHDPRVRLRMRILLSNNPVLNNNNKKEKSSQQVNGVMLTPDRVSDGALAPCTILKK